MSGNASAVNLKQHSNSAIFAIINSKGGLLDSKIIKVLINLLFFIKNKLSR